VSALLQIEDLSVAFNTDRGQVRAVDGLSLNLARGATLWQRVVARAGFLLSLALAVLLDTERLFFLAMIAPVILLFFVIFGLMGRWVAARAGATSAGLALGLILAWALGVSFPLFAPGASG